MSNNAKRLAEAEKVIANLVETLEDNSLRHSHSVTKARAFIAKPAFTQSSFRPICRSELINQLRHALHLAESRSEEVVEFDIADTDFCFEYD